MWDNFIIKRMLPSPAGQPRQLTPAIPATHKYFYEVERTAGVQQLMVSAVPDYQPGQKVRLNFSYLSGSNLLYDETTPGKNNNQRKSLDEELTYANSRGDITIEIIKAFASARQTGPALIVVQGTIKQIDPEIEFYDISTNRKIETCPWSDFKEGQTMMISTHMAEYGINPRHRLTFNKLATIQTNSIGFMADDPRAAEDIPGTKAYADALYERHRSFFEPRR